MNHLIKFAAQCEKTISLDDSLDDLLDDPFDDSFDDSSFDAKNELTR